MLASASDISATYTQWEALRAPETSAIGFADGESFLRNHPRWPDEKIIRLRTEAAALLERPDAGAMGSFCKDFPPISGRGMMACLRANAGTADLRKEWLKQGWLQGDFTDSEARTILADYGQQFTSADHSKRLERLLYEEKVSAAKRMMPLVPAARHRVYETRMAIIQNTRDAKAKLAALSTNERQDPGILFDRAVQARTTDRGDQLISLVSAAPANADFAELWWPLRNLAIREALADKHYKTAYSLAEHHGKLTGEPLAEALWLKGWIAFEYHADTKTGYTSFHSLYTNAKTPVSLARAAYWASRAAQANGNGDIAREWLEKAARHPTVFYGQLAHLALSPHAPLPLPSPPAITPAERAAFERDERVDVIHLLSARGDIRMRDRFLQKLANDASEPGQFVLISDLARSLGGITSGVKTAKLALRHHTILLDHGWPRFELPNPLGVEPSLALAITRQESEFDPNARSSANATGLMQLLPSTAERTAQRHGIAYTHSILEMPELNVTLGSLYLGQIISGFDGSYILGIASYNAGPANVRRWIATYGAPPKTLDGALRWIESIPFGETRNYVMRVLENLQVYRALETPDAPPRLTRDLAR